MNNEYHLIGPVVSSTRRNGCSLDCGGRISTIADDTSRRQEGVNRENHACRCKRIRRRNGTLPRQYPRSLREESPGRTFISDRPEESIAEPRFHSTRISVNGTNNADDRKFNSEELQHLCDCKDIRDDRQRDATRCEIKRRDEDPGPSGVKPSRAPSTIPMRNAKKARIDKQRAQRAAEDDEETVTEEDCVCHSDVTQILREQTPRRRRPRDRVFIRDRVRQNGQRRENDEEDEEDEIEERGMEDEDKEDERMEEEDEAEEEDEDTEDSIYRDLKAQSPRRRTKARERELKRWIRRCRQACERRMRAR